MPHPFVPPVSSTKGEGTKNRSLTYWQHLVQTKENQGFLQSYKRRFDFLVTLATHFQRADFHRDNVARALQRLATLATK